MFDQLLEGFRKASESSLQAQQEMLKQWMQQMPSGPIGGGKMSGDWTKTMQRRWSESATEALERHRALVDSAYSSGIQIIDHALRTSDAKSPEEYRRLLEELWTRLTASFKEQSEMQLRELQKALDRWLEIAQSAPR